MYHFSTSDPNKTELNSGFDRDLHHALTMVNRLSDFFRAPQPDANQNATVELEVMRYEFVVSGYFTRENVRKLSLLWVTIFGSYHESAKLLVRAGADVNEPFGLQIGYNDLDLDKNSTVLHVLAQMDPTKKNEELIRLVLEHGADLRARDSKGQTPLHIAVKKGRVLLTEMFLKKGADPNAVDGAGTILLLEAAGNVSANELLPPLLRRGADISVKDADGENVLHRLSRAPLEPVHLARSFIEKGISLDDREKSTRFQPIHVAVSRGNNEMVNLYLDHGADVNSLACDDVSPLHLATKNRSSLALLETLLTRGANVDQRRAETGRTALHEACANMDEEHIGLLLSAGADVLVEDRDGKTPFALFDLYYYHGKRPGTWLMIKKLAVEKVRRPSIELKDERIIACYPKLLDYYWYCVEQLERMNATRLIAGCTLFDVATKCHCQIAELMRNPELEMNFRKYDVTEFSTYAKDAIRVFMRARVHYHDLLVEQEEIINEAFYGTLPYVVVRRLVHYVCNCC